MDSIRPGSLSVYLVAFCRFLRTRGFNIGIPEVSQMLTTIGRTSSFNQGEFRLLLVHLLCRSRKDQLVFDELFEEFWQELFTSFDAKVKVRKTRANQRNPTRGQSLKKVKNWLYNSSSEDIEETSFYSTGKGSSNHTLSENQSGSIQELIQIVKLLSKKLASKPGRRKIPAKYTGRLDLRGMARRNINTGELIQLAFRKPKMQKPQLVLLCDVSRSMELFTDATVQLLFAFQSSHNSIETFVFGTELYQVSKSLKNKTFKKALDELTNQVPEWSGGTRIGHCLDQFIVSYGSRLLNKKVIFLVISDGWDTGEIDLLETSLAYIKRRVNKVIWLNPQADKPGFSPQVRGMVAALPFIDYLHGVTDLRSLVADYGKIRNQDWLPGEKRSVGVQGK